MPRKLTYTFGEAIFELGFKEAASLLGRKGGSRKSKAKAAAARDNGKLGGRPKKEPDKS